ncbi:MAG: uracil-DNA glycosylase [Frankiaceae bacterium]|nr:uracil-DNA glycosylase [Frankiaceae bacterium]
MRHDFCPGYPAPYDALVTDYPDETTYPYDSFRVEWGPIFHRGRLDGSARVLVIGQDPATEEDVTRRILVGTAGQRVQGLLTRLGITKSYVMINTFLYSVYGQSGGTSHLKDAGIVAYRHQWLDTLVEHNDFDAVITFGTLANEAFTAWAATPSGQVAALYQAALLHPTYPESAAASGQQSESSAFRVLLANWNKALPGLGAAITHTDQPATLKRYGYTFKSTDYTPIPEMDLPAGLPTWMRSTELWANRTGRTTDDKRATLTAAVPADLRAW